MAHMFQFTQPKRAATGGLFDVSPVFRVSIHAAQAGCDLRAGCTSGQLASFNSRSPSGLRHESNQLIHAKQKVSIHAAQAGCDRSILDELFACPFVSIHAAQAGCDKEVFFNYLREKFQFTQPKRAATFILHNDFTIF